MKRSSGTRSYTSRRLRRRRSRWLWFATVLLILLVAGAVLFEYRGLSSPEEAVQPEPVERPEQSGPAEQPQPEPSSEVESDRGLEDAWATAIANDPSPSLAAPGETMGYGHRIALTFDDGPDPATTPAILDILRAYNLKATFFVIGARAEQHPELIERIVNEGHALGNHTYYHRDMTRLTPDLMLEELWNTQAAIDQALGAHLRATMFRPPCGAPYNTETDGIPLFQQVMREQEMYPVMWNIDPRDWAFGDAPDIIVDNVAQSTPGDGGVLLLHDTQPQTVRALPGILDYYVSSGFGFTGVRNLLAEKYKADPETIQADPGASQPEESPRPDGSGEGDPEDVGSLADCLT